ncbi:hypothetical protein C9413_20755 [Rhizobium sp. SEMIA 4085]|uniref:Uncharacterized protein n=1 Tax=Rhizobium gallicum bv. gallicum R602sp TaxID=1041138 RepID=A0A0B4X1T6_9HYPH|nr:MULTISPECIES: hypothetical protein [Rhizobium]AJD41151.1 hypothetical protein RGR602_CH01819 [Rhizobium gallicum bv. gallicum R602sp]NNH31820.1 hypothetical protein [Rhizobium sp. SEMIA 4085]
MIEEGGERFVPDANQIAAQARKNRRNAQARALSGSFARHLQAESRYASTMTDLWLLG